MEEALAMTILGLKSASDAVIKKLVTTACSIPKRILKILLSIQIKLIYLSFNCFIRIYRVVLDSTPLKYIFPEKTSSPEPVVDHKAVVKGVKKVRRVLCGTFEQMYGWEVKSDMRQLKERIDEVHRCMAGDDNKKTFEALAKLREFNKPFEDGTWKNRHIDELELREITVDESEEEDNKSDNILEERKSKTPVTVNLPNEQEIQNPKEIKQDQRLHGVHQHRPARNKCQENGVLKNRLTVTNAKLEEVLRMSSNLVGELTRLNTQVSRLAIVSEKMAAMQYEIGEGRKLLCEIEADRNEMKRKLSTLERMIQEEEQYLDDVSCESGYDESEMPNH